MSSKDLDRFLPIKITFPSAVSTRIKRRTQTKAAPNAPSIRLKHTILETRYPPTISIPINSKKRNQPSFASYSIHKIQHRFFESYRFPNQTPGHFQTSINKSVTVKNPTSKHENLFLKKRKRFFFSTFISILRIFARGKNIERITFDKRDEKTYRNGDIGCHHRQRKKAANGKRGVGVR